MQINMKYFLRQTARFLHTKIRIYTPEGALVKEVSRQQALDDALLFLPEVEETLLSADLSTPLLADINRTYSYAAIRISESVLVMGPVRTEHAYHFHTHFQLHFSGKENTVLSNLVSSVNWEDYLYAVLMLANLPVSDTVSPDSSPEISEDHLVVVNCLPKDHESKIRWEMAKTLLQNTEKQIYHHPYDQELREISAIENGDLEMLEKSLDEGFSFKCGRFSGDALRDSKDLAIIAIATASRAAIRGGVSPETAFTLSDLYIHQIEDAKMECLPLQLVHNAEYQYTLLVRKIKETQVTTPSRKENEHIINCKNYIFRHVHEHIRVRDIAEALTLNPSYLSDLFRRTEGIVLSEYILRQKLIRVKNLLVYSHYSYSEIAGYMGFASQSYLGKLFKEDTGMTLREYRTRYQMQEFMG